MYRERNLVVTAGSVESTVKTVTLDEGKRGYELVVYNGSTSAMTLTVGNIEIYVPGNSVLDEAFKPFTSFIVAGTGTDTWSWYIRG